VAVTVLPDPRIRDLVVSVLGELGFTIEPMGGDALGPIPAGAAGPSLLVADVGAAAPGGLDTCIRLLERPEFRGVPLVALVDPDDDRAMGVLIDAGGIDFVTHPVSRARLSARIRQALRIGWSQRENRVLREELDAVHRIARLGHWKWDLTTGTMSWSETALGLLDVPSGQGDPQLTDLLIRVHHDDANRVAEFLDAALRGAHASEIDFRVPLSDGTVSVLHARLETTLDDAGNPRLASGTLQDITERKRTESKIRFLAFYDNLTGLPNRLQFRKLLEKSLTAARRARRMAAVMFMDLDNFKKVNDTAGHSAGDRLLRAAAERLKEVLRATDTVARQAPTGLDLAVARVGGDEFIVLLPEIARPDDPAKVARRILDSFKDAFDVGGAEVFVSTSIGISIYPQDGEDPEALLKNADVALYHAKDAGRNNFQFFSPTQNDAAFRRLSLESSLRKAIERNELVVHYQPQVLAREGRLIGVEALVRWNHPDMGLVYPDQFVPLAEETGLIQEIDEWVLRTACAQSAKWAAAGLPKINMAVNLSAHEFRRTDLVDRIGSIVVRERLEPAQIELEITESVLMEQASRTMDILIGLKARGFRIAVDDFGTGYSSLAYLKRFRADVLKIDRSFVKDVATSPDDAAIVAAIITLANTLRMTALAEGVENTPQRAFLHEQGCELMQGHLFGKPMPAEMLEDLLRLQSAERMAEEAPVPEGALV
jgi:diguanylate cyclase (GGDEF)-like protein